MAMLSASRSCRSSNAHSGGVIGVVILIISCADVYRPDNKNKNKNIAVVNGLLTFFILIVELLSDIKSKLSFSSIKLFNPPFLHGKGIKIFYRLNECDIHH